MRFLLGVTTLVVLALVGCGANKKIPDDMQGRYPTTHLLVDEMTVVVEANAIAVEGCDTNCGVDRLALTDVTYAPSAGTVTFTSAHCTGTIERRSSDISITARPVPGATGDEQIRRNFTCENISGLLSRGT